MAALLEQSVVVVGTNAAGVVLPKLAGQLLSLRHLRDEIAAQVEALVEAHHPLHKVLTSMPGIRVRIFARILTEVTGKHFASAAHLASASPTIAGLLRPQTRRRRTAQPGPHRPRTPTIRLLFAMLRDVTIYQEPDPRNLSAAA